MSQETGYQGWKNYHTWLVANHIANTEGEYTYWREEAEGRYRDAFHTWEEREQAKEDAQETLAGQLKDSFQGALDEAMKDTESLWYCAAQGMIDDCDWDEIAEAQFEDMDFDAIERELAEDE